MISADVFTKSIRFVVHGGWLTDGSQLVMPRRNHSPGEDAPAGAPSGWISAGERPAEAGERFTKRFLVLGSPGVTNGSEMVGTLQGQRLTGGSKPHDEYDHLSLVHPKKFSEARHGLPMKARGGLTTSSSASFMSCEVTIVTGL